jgi:heme exporter protein A
MSLRNAGHQQVRTYSSGMRQRLSLARAMLHDPDLLLLDEPYSGLDQHGSRLLTQLLEQLREAGKTVLLITHNLSEGLALSNRVVILNQGQVVFESPREGIDTAVFESLYFQHVES